MEIEAAAPVENAVVTVSDGKRVLGSRSVQLHAGMNRVSVPFTIEHPELWWCRGMGEPHLYTFRTSVELGGRVLAGHSAQVGLRSVTVEKKPDAYGRSLRFLLNGEPVFCKGANYIPCDCFLPRVTRETYERTIRDAVDVNMNMLRVWGGGIYEDDFFYELCDREGILIWQDFMYACAVYPAEGALLENMRLEAVDNVKRLRNHACVVYWCGNNENQDSWLSGWKYDVDKVDPKYSDIIWKQYEEQYYRMLAQVVAEYAPDMGYQPTSPFSDYGAMSNDHEGDRHYWEVWHAKKPITEYNRQRSRFFSEYGFQSFPCFETVKRYAPLPGDQDITSEVMMSHQRGGEHANNLIKSYLLNEYHEPRDFESFLYASQILQGDAIKTAIEAHRRDKGYCWGSLYWQHNDCWPVASWSSRDWYGVWKAQHYFARYAFADILISPILDGGRLDIYAVSDLLTPEKGTLCVRAVRLTGDRGIRTADRRPGQRQHESRRHRHADAAERSRSGGGRHSGDIHRCGEDIPQQLLPRTAENDELPESDPALQGRPGRRGVRRHRPVGQLRAGRLSVGRRRNGALLRQLLRPHAGRNAHRPRGVGTERQAACAAPEINVAGRHLLTPKNRYP